MKTLLIISFLSILLLSSCSDCTWVSTGHNHDSDGDVVEEGYWDCTDDNPITYDFVQKPDIEIKFNSNTNRSTKINSYYCSVKLSNNGNAAAQKVVCKVTITRPNVPGFYSARTIKKERVYELIDNYQSETFNFSFSDISYSGCCMFTGKIEVEYFDSSGKSLYVSKGFQL